MTEALSATLAEWRAAPAHRADPARLALIEALARRAAAHQGAARQVIDARLARLVEEYRALLAARAAAPLAAQVPPAPARGALGALVDAVAVRARPGPQAAAPALAEPLSTAEAAELPSVRRYRGTWSRLSAEERLRQTLAQVPPQAGPLNSLHLLHRALVQMRDVAPGYLQHFVAHVDALLWLEQAQAVPIPAPPARGGAAARRKPVTRKG